MPDPHVSRPPDDEIFPLEPRLPILLGIASVAFILTGALVDPGEGLDVAFLGVGVLGVVGTLWMAQHTVATLYGNHLRVGSGVFRYRDIVSVQAGEFALPGKPRRSQPYLYIQCRGTEAPELVRTLHIRGGPLHLEARLKLRLARAQAQGVSPNT